eukprot:scaffold6446_cov77-Cylindrotheca_fusiformis.AAC.1
MLFGNPKDVLADAIKASKLEFTQQHQNHQKTKRRKTDDGISNRKRQTTTTVDETAARTAKILLRHQQRKPNIQNMGTILGEERDKDVSNPIVVETKNKSLVQKQEEEEEAKKIAAHMAKQRKMKVNPKMTTKPGRGITSKSPLATRQDWLDVMIQQPVYRNFSEMLERKQFPLQVGYVTDGDIKGPSQHVFYDGIQGSSYLEMKVLCSIKAKNCTLDEINNVDLWLIDANSAKNHPFPNDIVHQILAVDNPTFQIFFVDYSDRLVLRKGFVDWNYPDIDEERFLQSHVRFAIRCIDKYRRWAPSKGYMNIGRLVHPILWDEMLITKGGPPLHAPFAARTDIIESIQKILPDMVTNQSSSCLSSPLPFHPVDCIQNRPIDIIHLWKIEIPALNCNLRNLASETVQTMGNWSHPTEAGRRLRVETSIQGFRAHIGRQRVSQDYVMTMLQSKIIVVTQRDQWEDHFRLFEALSAGAMILMDEMLSLPHSLKDGESVVFFRSITELQEKAMYYLEHTKEREAIARKGWEITMEKHRSWHRLEELLFGEAKTNTSLIDSWPFSQSRRGR